MFYLKNVDVKWPLIKFVFIGQLNICIDVFDFQQREIDERAEGERVEQVRKQIIEEERVKLLREHAHRLLGYLPKVKKKTSFMRNLKIIDLYIIQGVIRDEKDLDYLGNDFKNEFKRRQINMQHPDGWDNI